MIRGKKDENEIKISRMDSDFRSASGIQPTSSK